MSELDRELTELRADLHAALSPPDLTKVAGRARQRSVRRRMQVGAVAAVVVVSVVVPALRAVPAAPPGIPPFPAPAAAYQVDFADTDSGYALRRVCAEVDGPCRSTLFVTGDAGRRWAQRDFPGDEGWYANTDIMVFGANALAIFRVSEAETVTRMFSADGGRTWNDNWPSHTAAPAPIAAGAQLTPMCAAPAPDCERSLASMDKATGVAVPVPTQPPLSDPVPGLAPTQDGRYWAVGRHQETDGWALAVTSDGGVTWSTSVLTVPGVPDEYTGWHVVERDGVMFASVAGSFGGNRPGVLGVFRSTDGGKSWTRTWVGSPGSILSNGEGSPVLTKDGRLLMFSATHGTFESTDGVTFTRAERQLPTRVTWTRAGYLVETAQGSYELSTDGVSWRKFTVR